ncbi:MAG TPA: tRNA (adenosine(37)-N6)-threonylcarbamoyltransferase complex dimerization subunit type 1 TsaB [Micropepsaceae bacterium]|nr:tRNA (adenosine(37)-N6)-threonylcarbamoyltransferase complex dimerization subunit type 1 TsaB [Micropepsaceae bacterium]
MNILGIDTALGACSAALTADARVVAHAFEEMQRGHAEALAPMVDALMRNAGLSYAALNRIAVTTGPGTFTGQRVGLAFARAMALALKIPAVGVTTLDVMAEAALEKIADADWAIVAADAKRGEIYLGARSRAEALIAPELIVLAHAPERIGTAAKKGAVAVAGTGAEALIPLLRDAGFAPIDSAIRQPDAVFVARLGAHAQEGPPPKPLYLRPPDAKPPGAIR